MELSFAVSFGVCLFVVVVVDFFVVVDFVVVDCFCLFVGRLVVACFCLFVCFVGFVQKSFHNFVVVRGMAYIFVVVFLCFEMFLFVFDVVVFVVFVSVAAVVVVVFVVVVVVAATYSVCRSEKDVEVDMLERVESIVTSLLIDGAFLIARLFSVFFVVFVDVVDLLVVVFGCFRVAQNNILQKGQLVTVFFDEKNESDGLKKVRM